MPPETPLVSVLVPSFNKARYIEETLQSVYAQTLAQAARIEIIVVDDGSTDGSPALLERHRDRCTVILGPNRGASAARQTALDNARGEHIQYLDADDLLLPRALELQTTALEQSGADVSYGDWQRYVLSQGTFVRGDIVASKVDAATSDAEVACFRHFWSPPAALLYRRALIERMPPWHASLPVIQDARYLQEAAFAGARFVHVPELVALYREDATNSLSKGSNKKFVRDMLVNALEVEALWRGREGGFSEERRQVLEDTYGAGARMIFEEDDALYEECYAAFRGVGGRGALRWPVISHRLKSALGKQRATAVLRALKKL